MMAEYIEREALLRDIADIRMKHGLAEGEEMEFTETDIAGLLQCVPAADVAQVRHGRWDDSGRYMFPGGSTAVRCTECGCSLTVSEYRLNKWDYCPVCGAKMDGGADNGE